MKKIELQFSEFKLIEISLEVKEGDEENLKVDKLIDDKISPLAFNGYLSENFSLKLSNLKKSHKALKSKVLWHYSCISKEYFIQTILPALITINSSSLEMPHHLNESLNREVYENELMSPWSLEDIDETVRSLFPDDCENILNFIIFNYSIYRDLMEGGHFEEGLEIALLKQWES